MAGTRALESAPLSHIQEQLWLVEQLAAGGSMYSEAVALRLRGPLDPDAVERSLGEIARRHDVLRTVLPQVDGQPVQRVLPALPLRLTPPLQASEEELPDLLRRLVEQPFDLAAGPLFRCWLIRLAERDHALVLNVDHLVADAWSFAIILDELRAIYDALAAGRPSPLPERELQYADFAEWERDLLATGVLDEDVRYWRERLAGVDPVLRLPVEGERPPVKGNRGERIECPLGDHLAAPLLRLGRAHGATEFVTILATYSALLARYGRYQELVIGTPVANRGRPELSGMVGNFANTLPIRVDLEADPDLSRLLAHCRERCVEAMDHQHLALGKIVELTAPGRDASRTPLIQFTILRKEMPLREPRLGEAEAAWLEIPRTRGRLDAIVEVDLAPGRLRAWVEYDGEVYERPSIERLMADYARVIEAWTADPSLRVSHLPVDPPAARPAATVRAGAPPAPAPAAVGPDPLLDLVAGVWAEAMGLSRLGPDDDFFRLGGHSMLAARLVQRLREPLGIDIPLRTLWENSTPGAFTAELRRRHPELDALLEGLQGLSPGELDQLLGAEPGGPEQGGAAVRPAEAPLSFSQQHFWAMEELDPGSLTHTIPCSFRFRGAFDPASFREALNGVVARHDGLRTTIAATAAGPVQRVAPQLVVDVPLFDLTGLPEAAREAEADRLERVGAHQGFALASGPLLAAHVVRVAPDDHRAMLNFHHLVTDEVSMTIVCRELSELYAARLEGRSPRLPEPRLHLEDFALWEREQLTGPRLARLEGFWRRQLQGAPVLDLPTDHPRPPRLTFEGDSLSRRAPRALFEAVGEVARQARATPYAVFTAATVELLRRLSGQDELVIGAPSENRTMPGSEGIVGCLLNVLPLRVDCAGDPTFLELVRRLRDTLLAAYDHQALPLGRMVEAVNPPRQPGRLPFFGVSCQMQLSEWMPLSLPGCDIQFDVVGHGTARYDMAYHALPKPDHFWLGLELNTNLWNRSTGERLLADLEAGLGEVTGDPTRRLSSYRYRHGATVRGRSRRCSV